MSYIHSSKNNLWKTSRNVEDLLYAKMEHPQVFVSILKGICITEKCLCTISSRGIKFATVFSNSSQSICFITAEMFEVFRLVVAHLTFQINLTILLDCLQIFGNYSDHVTLFIHYQKHSPLLLVLEDNGIVTECAITTEPPYDMLSLHFGKYPILCHVIMKPECLKDIFGDLDIGNPYLLVKLLPSLQIIRFFARGHLGQCQIDINNNPELITKMTWFSDTEHSFEYKTNSLKQFSKAVAVANISSFTINNKGNLCIQFLINSEHDKVGFIEFTCIPNTLAPK